MNEEYILSVKDVYKSFPGVKALEGVSFQVRKGSVHALMGENGAGKSTLAKIIIGIYQADSGEVIFDGKELKSHNVGESIDIGISMIHQELSPIPQMTVAENIFLGREPLTNMRLVDKKKMYQDTRDLLSRLGMSSISPSAKMASLSVAKTQMVEIAKAISYDSKLVIMDEPTSAITETEVEQLFKIVNELKSEGVAFIFISHKLDEIFTITDEITVLRDGQFAGTDFTKNLNKSKLISMMVGREINNLFPKIKTEIGDVILSVKNLTKKGLFKNVSFELRRGEILGIAGLMGAGRTEVVETLFGYRKADAGEIYIHGKKVSIKSPEDAVKNKMALLTEDRKQTGLFLPLSCKDNMIIASLGEYMNGIFLNSKKINTDCVERKTKLSIKTPSLSQTVKNLSGGNQQKVLVARWLLTKPDIFIVDEPTRGVDVGAKAEIHSLLSQLAHDGKAVIMISSELPEILGMSDRIIVMHEGKVTGELCASEANQTKVMEFATNSHVQSTDGDEACPSDDGPETSKDVVDLYK
ncbi:sugar ABC transporter ATP-binding protein [Dethiobacter alkaliphilus]|uniref:sugar ABC transporter ATP-binding protein n=1 Tax=Dethiobacter alkaliphilus TaxID=427926 RepID=UPI002226444C|nr:sugar ABC transporter ATP-binding protein [Dethiobacter alkaliphilus]MCW3489989.1 sugar ABC transporter ATP-binding protein [Dethiobacter alkaliphilus]